MLKMFIRDHITNQIETYYEYGFKINRMTDSKKYKNPNNEQGWRKKTKNSVYLSLIVNLVLHTYLDYVFCYNYLKKIFCNFSYFFILIKISLTSISIFFVTEISSNLQFSLSNANFQQVFLIQVLKNTAK